MNLLDLFLKVGVKDEASGEVSKIGEGVKTTLAAAAKVGAAALGAASAAAGALVKQSISAYADYEQLVGGVETLFGKSAGTVEGYAERAYKTAGLSANKYMETVTGFSAALLQSLDGDTAAAADKADMAITDMADNANKMGSSMESIQNAYAGFAKQNYTMLDNLKLGYSGTKEEMQRLLTEAEKISGIKYDISSYGDIVDAIHVVQKEMGITGTTAKEAEKTISGSLATMGGAWSNLIAGMSDDNANMDALIRNLVESVGSVVENIAPRIGIALEGLGQIVTGLAPVISEQLPPLIETLLPQLLAAGGTLLQGLATGIITALPTLAQTGLDIVLQLATALITALPQFVTTAAEIIVTLADGIAEAIPTLIPTIVEVVLAIVQALIENAPALVESALEIMLALADGIINSLPILIEKAPEIISQFVLKLIELAPELLKSAAEMIAKLVKGIGDNLPDIFTAAMDTIIKFIDGLTQKIKDLPQNGREMIESVKEGLMEKIEEAKQWGKDLISNFIEGIKQKWEDLKQTVADAANMVKDFLGFSEPKEGPLSNFHTYAPDMMDLYSQGIRDNLWKVRDALGEVPTLPVNEGYNGAGTIHNYIEIGGQPLLDFVNDGLGVAL